MSLPDDFTKLREKVDKADQSIRAGAAKDEAELKAMVDDARKKADQRAAVLHAKSEEVADSAEHQWHEVQSDWDAHIKRIRERIDAKQDKVDAAFAENDAKWAEGDAITPSTSRQLRSRRLSTRCSMPCWRAGRPTSWLPPFDLVPYAGGLGSSEPPSPPAP